MATTQTLTDSLLTEFRCGVDEQSERVFGLSWAARDVEVLKLLAEAAARIRAANEHFDEGTTSRAIVRQFLRYASSYRTRNERRLEDAS